MSVSFTSSKRKQDLPYQNGRISQKKTNKHLSTFTPAFWEGLSRVWLTRIAIRELDRRNRPEKSLNHPTKYPLHSSPFPLFTLKHLEDINKIAKSGGFDLTDLRGYHEPMERDPANDGSASGTRPTSSANTRTKNSEPHDRNFEQKLIDIGVFPVDDDLPGGAGPVPTPLNFEQLQERAQRPRPSLSLDRFTNADYQAFIRSFKSSKTEADIMTNIIPIIEGTNEERDRSCDNKPLNNFRPLTAGLVCGTLDKYHGSNPADVLLEVQRELGDLIFPSTVEDMPVAPNFFLEVKSAFGMPGVANRQALQTGALGERSQIALRAWRRDGPGLDKMAHTITSTYIHGWITLYSIHAEDSRIQENRIDYYMNRISSYTIINGAESFRMAASAHRNLRDFAEEQRRQSINMANNMAHRTGDMEE